MRPWTRRLLCAAWSLACATTTGCVEADAFYCDQHEDCVSPAGLGRCEATSHCSYDDARCESSRRYSELAGALANACVEPEGQASSITESVDTASDDDDASDEAAGDEAGSDESGAPSDDGGEPLPPGGELVWSRLVSHPEGGSDRFLAVALSDDRIIAAGQQLSDLSFVAIAPANGNVLASMIHNVGGTDDAVHSLVRGAAGELVACGRNDDVVLGRSAWIGTVDAALAGPPLIASFWGDHACHVVTELDGDRMIAAGDGVPIVPGPPEYAWMYAFDRGNPTLGTVHENEGQGSVWHAAAHVDGELMFGGRLDADGEAGKGVVVGLDEADIPSQVAVISDALWAVHALAPDSLGFVLGGYESTGGAPAAWVSAHTKGGDERWSWRPGHAQWTESRIEDVAVDGQGFAVAVGSASDGSDQQRWIVRLDPQGEPVWSYTLPNEMVGGWDIASAVVLLPEGDIVVVGEAEVAPGEMDAWVARFSADAG